MVQHKKGNHHGSAIAFNDRYRIKAVSSEKKKKDFRIIKTIKPFEL
jgi:hypothetical protein